jgi:hypothetical protein
MVAVSAGIGANWALAHYWEPWQSSVELKLAVYSYVARQGRMHF